MLSLEAKYHNVFVMIEGLLIQNLSILEFLDRIRTFGNNIILDNLSKIIRLNPLIMPLQNSLVFIPNLLNLKFDNSFREGKSIDKEIHIVTQRVQIFISLLNSLYSVGGWWDWRFFHSID